MQNTFKVIYQKRKTLIHKLNNIFRFVDDAQTKQFS